MYPLPTGNSTPAYRVWSFEMNAETTDPARGWEELQARLAGSFTAQSRGRLVGYFSLTGPEGEFGWMEPRGLAGAAVASGALSATIERTGDTRYRMVTDDVLVLVSKPAGRSADLLEIRAGGRAYEARASFFRNRAAVRSSREEEIAELKGNLTGRRYAIAFDPEAAGALPVAVFLLYHTVSHRSRAFQTG